MRLSTSTNICAFTATRERLPAAFAIDVCADAGYRVLDINWCMAMNPDSPLRGDAWEAYVDDIGGRAAARGIEFSQSHLPYFDALYNPDPQTDFARTIVARCVEASRRLRVPWAVLHPAAPRRTEDFTRVNIDILSPVIEQAARWNVGVALENIETPSPGARRGAPDESIARLAALVDAFRDPRVGVCYDFGHANLFSDDHRGNLNALGTRVKALHVHDNHGAADEHLLPFFGSIDWREAMAGLRDIGYAGDLTYEIQEFGRNLPKELKYTVVRQSFAVGQALLRLIGGESSPDAVSGRPL